MKKILFIAIFLTSGICYAQTVTKQDDSTINIVTTVETQPTLNQVKQDIEMRNRLILQYQAEIELLKNLIEKAKQEKARLIIIRDKAILLKIKERR